jgi:phospholipase C
MSRKTSLPVTLSLLIWLVVSATALANGDINKLNHIIIVMQENHSFDNYLGVLPYAPGTPYHQGPCHRGDHSCVDGLTCTRSSETGVGQLYRHKRTR